MIDPWIHTSTLVKHYGEQIQGIKKELPLVSGTEKVRYQQNIQRLQEEATPYVKRLEKLFQEKRSKLENQCILAAAEDTVRLHQQLEDLVETYHQLLKNLV